MAERELSLILRLRDELSGNLSSVDTNIKKLEPTFKKMAVLGTAAIGAISTVAISALKEFAESEKLAAVAGTAINNALQSMSFDQLEKLHKGMDPLLEDFEIVEKQMQAVGRAAIKLGYDDDTARLAFAKLFAVSKDVAQSQKDVALAMDLAAYSGRSLEESADAITRVHAGATRVLREFGIELKEGATTQEALAALQERTAGTAEQLSHTLEGQTRILEQQFANLKEQIGGALAPAITELLTAITPVVERFSEWAQKNPDLIAKIILVSGAVAALVAGLGILGLALPGIIAGFTVLGTVLAFIAANPIVLIIGALALVATMLKDQIAALYGVEVTWKEVWNQITSVFSAVVDWLSDRFLEISNGLQSLFDFVQKVIAAFERLPSVAQSAISSIANTVASSVIPGFSVARNIVNAIPFADGGIVTRPTLGLVGEAGPEAIIPLSKAGGIGGSITINVYGDVSGDELVQKVKDGLMRSMRFDSRLSIA